MTMKKIILFLGVTVLLSGCVAIQKVDRQDHRADSEISDAQLIFEKFQHQFERLAVYSDVIGSKANDERVKGISRFPLIREKQNIDGILVKYAAKCPVGFELDNRGVIIKPSFGNSVTDVEEILDCKHFLDDYSVYVSTGKTIPERLKLQQDEYYQEAQKNRGSLDYGYWIKKAADIGHIEAQYETGLEYLKGEVFPKNYETGIDYLTKAAYSGHAVSQYLLGQFYMDMNRSGDDLAMAYAMFKAGALQGQNEATQQLSVLQAKLNQQKNGKDIVVHAEELLKKIKAN